MWMKWYSATELCHDSPLPEHAQQCCWLCKSYSFSKVTTGACTKIFPWRGEPERESKRVFFFPEVRTMQSAIVRRREMGTCARCRDATSWRASEYQNEREMMKAEVKLYQLDIIWFQFQVSYSRHSITFGIRIGRYLNFSVFGGDDLRNSKILDITTMNANQADRLFLKKYRPSPAMTEWFDGAGRKCAKTTR